MGFLWILPRKQILTGQAFDFKNLDHQTLTTNTIAERFSKRLRRRRNQNQPGNKLDNKINKKQKETVVATFTKMINSEKQNQPKGHMVPLLLEPPVTDSISKKEGSQEIKRQITVHKVTDKMEGKVNW